MRGGTRKRRRPGAPGPSPTEPSYVLPPVPCYLPRLARGAAVNADCDGVARRNDDDAEMGAPVALADVRGARNGRQYCTVLTWTHGECLPVWQSLASIWGLSPGENPDYDETTRYLDAGLLTGDIAG